MDSCNAMRTLPQSRCPRDSPLSEGAERAVSIVHNLDGGTVYSSKIRDKGRICRFFFLGESFQVVQIHPAEHRVIFLVSHPAVKGG